MLRYVKGDATDPQGRTRHTLILHVVNDQGGWGRGFVAALNRRSTRPQQAYRAWHATGRDSRNAPFALGQVQIVRLDDELYVANLLAQRGYKTAANPRPLDYRALDECLGRLASRLARATGVSLHAPRLGAGLGGGHWPTIEALLLRHLADYDLTIYDL